MSKLLSISDKPLIIAGPCSVESPDRLNAVVKSLESDPRIGLIRCGVWKPRTRPGGFEGMGEPALQWIAACRQQMATPLPFCCEVARPEHVALCVQYGIDAVWLGARTSVNPFLVGELAEAMRGTHLAVMVKNPITPDISLWIGALERLKQAGIDDLAAIHRGFSTYNNFGYRNNPLWEIPIELRRRMPEVPLLCDPSHIGGRRELVAPLSQMALDLHFDGLIVECHPEPDSALTDSQQQITPNELITLLDNLKPRTHKETGPSDLQRMREQLDVIDAEILRLLSQRMKISKDIGTIKQAHNMPIYQPHRWQQVLDRQMQAARELGLDEEFVRELTEKIHGESLRMQK
ncbi:MAG: bifunctional 3-deoxy-7-phosphoheptulonate synthase/chorismate mutase type II [Bacteroidales bacterium]|nr:bifunctional 3-deoxy-7-phosphoheptulonate synthase/chorismate mutase type II [Bacteroidales bacterium]